MRNLRMEAVDEAIPPVVQRSVGVGVQQHRQRLALLTVPFRIDVVLRAVVPEDKFLHRLVKSLARLLCARRLLLLRCLCSCSCYCSCSDILRSVCDCFAMVIIAIATPTLRISDLSGLTSGFLVPLESCAGIFPFNEKHLISPASGDECELPQDALAVQHPQLISEMRLCCEVYGITGNTTVC